MSKHFEPTTDVFMDIGELADTKLPDPTLLEYYRLLKNREIVWNTEIDDSMIDIPLYIMKWNREDAGTSIEERKPIKIWINSNGGDADITAFTANVITLSHTPVITIGMGKVYSSGCLLLMAGHKRLVFESTSALIHDGSTGAIGDMGKVIDNIDFAKRQEEHLRAFILSHTKIPCELLDKNFRRDWFLLSDEIIEYGIADSIITDICEVL